MTGYTAEEAIGKTPRILQGPRTDKTVLSRLRHNLERGEVFAGEAINYRKDREEFYLEWQIAPLRNASGKITHFVSTQHDITERKRAEVALRASEARYRTLFEYAPDGIVIVDSKGYYLDVNTSICRMLGYTRDEFIGLNATDIVAPAEIPHIGQALDVIQNKSDYQREWQFRRKDGSVFAVDTIAAAMPDGNLLAMIRDITERKRAERRLVTQNAISRVLADSNTLNEATPKIIQAICESEGWDFGTIWEADRKSNVLRCLEIWRRPELQAEELMAKTRELTFTSNTGLPGRVWASGKPLLIMDVANDDNYPRASLAEKIGLHSAVAFPITVEGEVIGVIDFLGREIHTTDEEMLEMLLGVGRQIGSFFKRKKVEEQFRQSQKMEGIGQLASGVAHDFNNILAIIQLQADLLKAEGGLSPAQTEFVGEIGEASQRAAALTRQLLLFSRKEKLLLRELNLNESIGDMTKMLRRILGEDIQLQFKFAMQP
jgi:PAS domain S-box-containing protein